MNKQSFIERLNLLLDEELSPQDSEELLAEIRENPEYHRIYLQYCQLFNACSQLGDKVAAPKATGQWRQKVYAYGGMAAAVALLLLAARNLSPMLDGFDGEHALAGSSSQGLDNEFVESLRVMNVNDLNGETVLLGDSLTPVSFDLDGAFDRNRTPHNFGSDSDVTFASFTVVQDKQIENVWSEREFTFGEAVETSTFQHETLRLNESANQGFDVKTMGASFEAANRVDRYEFGNSAAIPLAAKP